MAKTKQMYYRDYVKTEFIDMLAKFLDGRPRYHEYIVDRCCLTATLVGFSYHYYTMKDGDGIAYKRLELGKYGTIEFKLLENFNEYYVITTPNYESILKEIITAFPTVSIKISLEDI